ncbi:MAG: cyclic nucleotide-binding domain-containing protein [Pseudomonadota bacterium]
METLDATLNALVDHSAWNGMRRDRLILFLESATLRHFEAGETLFQQYHPATNFYLLVDGELTNLGAAVAPGDTLSFGPTERRFAPVGWSGFLAPQRYGTTTVASRDSTLLAWPHAALSGFFYADPELAIRCFDLVLAGVTGQVVDLRARRVDELGLEYAAELARYSATTPPLVGPAVGTLRRSAFFSRFDDATVAKLAESAKAQLFEPGSVICRQGDATGGLMLLARGRCELTFEDGTKQLPFRTLERQVGLIAGLPAAAEEFVAEATCVAQTPCWVYQLPQAALRRQMLSDPEFGRAFQQRQLARLSGLLSSLRVVSGVGAAEPEAAAVASLIANQQTRLPVTSALYRVPHLLADKLTHANAFATLATIVESGSYEERLIAGQCRSLTRSLAAEHEFFQTILETCERVISAPDDEPADAVRAHCDRGVLTAFAYLETDVAGLDELPATPGHVFVLNHLACPEYYELPNRYHFSFDTAFVAAQLFRHYGASALRVVRESPDAEFGHNLFYRRLGHVTVPTVESGVADISDDELAERRRAAGQRFIEQAAATLHAGLNVVVCPEGQSQRVEQSPAHFHSGAFRLAQAVGAKVIPVCLAGFHRRFKDGPLLARVLPPLSPDSAASARELAELCRSQMAAALLPLLESAERPARLPNRSDST